MRKWLYDNPWIWVVVFLGCVIAASVATVIIAEVNKPEIVKPKDARRPRGGSPAHRAEAWRAVGGLVVSVPPAQAEALVRQAAAAGLAGRLA